MPDLGCGARDYVAPVTGSRVGRGAESPSRPRRESLKTPSRAKSRVALNKTESLRMEICRNIVVEGAKLLNGGWCLSPELVNGVLVFFMDVWSDFQHWPVL